MGTALGNIFESLGQSLPALGQQYDKSQVQQQQYLLDLANAKRQQEMADAQLPQMQAETQSRLLANQAAQTQQDRLGQAVSKVNELNALPQQISQLQGKQTPDSLFATPDQSKPWERTLGFLNGAPGGADITPLSPEYAGKLDTLSSLSPLERGRNILGSVSDVGPAKEQMNDLQQQQLRDDQIAATELAREAQMQNQRDLKQMQIQAQSERQKEHQEFLVAVQDKKQPETSDIQYAANEIAKGRMVPSDLKAYFPYGFSGSKARIETLRQASDIYGQDHPGEQLNEGRLNRDYNNFKSSQSTKAMTAVETFLPNLDKLQAAISQLPTNTPISALNTYLQKGEVQFGDKAATNVHMLKGVLAHELGASLGGGIALSDERIKMALNALNTNSTRETALNALDLLRSLEVNRHVNVALQGGVYGEQYIRDFYGDDIGQRLIDEEHAARKKTGSAIFNNGSNKEPNAPVLKSNNVNQSAITDYDVIAKYRKKP